MSQNDELSRIAVISDSHIPARANKIPGKFVEELKKADLIVHCGDFETKEVYSQLEEYGKFIGVKGNCDRFEVQNSATFEAQGIEIGVYHGTGMNPRGHHPTLVATAEKLDCEVLLHGHTHQQEAVEKDGKVLLNPGSCTGVGGATAESGNPEMMILKPGTKLEVELVELEDNQLETETKEFMV